MEQEVKTWQQGTEKDAKITLVVYILQLASVFFGLTFIVAVIINYVKKEDIQGTWLESHLNWQIRTFWYGLLLGVIGFITSFIFIGTLIWVIAYIWVLYRAIKGLIYLNDNKQLSV